MSQGQVSVFLPNVITTKINAYTEAVSAERKVKDDLNFYFTMIAASAYVQGFVANREDGFRAIAMFQDAERSVTEGLLQKLKDENEKMEARRASDPGLANMLDLAQRQRAKQAAIDHEKAKQETVHFDPTTQESLLSLGLNPEDLLGYYKSFLVYLQQRPVGGHSGRWPEGDVALLRAVDDWVEPILNIIYCEKSRTEGLSFYKTKLVSVCCYHFGVIHSTYADVQPGPSPEPETPAPEPEPAPAVPAVEQKQAAIDAEARLAAQIDEDTDEDQKGFEKDVAIVQKECGQAIFNTVELLSKSLPKEAFNDTRKLAQATRGMLIATQPAIVERIRELDFGRDAYMYVIEQSRDKMNNPKTAAASVSDEQNVAPRRRGPGRPPRGAK